MSNLSRLPGELTNPVEFIRLISKNVRVFCWTRYMRSKGVKVGKNISLKGKPKIERFTGTIRIGDNVVLRSHSRGYHSALYAPTRLMTDTKPDATIEIGDNTRVNGACIHATERITIGRDCLIAANVTILDSDGHGLLPNERHLANPVSAPVTIEDNVWVGISVIVLKGVRIGKNSVVAAGSVVVSDVPPNCVAAGNPARIVKTFE
jgi:acetyltransferase-like isoleucine patch superfamily enzyme